MISAARESHRILGNYVLERQVGVGGMGVVFAARHRQLGHRVAIKLMHPELVNDDLVERFTREGQAAARLRSPHVARVLDVGVDEAGAPYLTMEFLDGRDLEQVLQQNGALSLDQAIHYLLQICEAVAEAHATGIIHRDLKPGNLFLTRDAYGDECVKVLDFGISKLIEEKECVGSPKLTGAAVVIGTPHYMPPEQMRAAHQADSRADVWALGAIFFEMLTGTPAWAGATLSEVCMRVASDPAPQARDRCPSLPALVDVIISTCLGKDPAQRYQSVSALVAAMAPLAPALVAAALERIGRLIGGGAPLTLALGVGASPSTLASGIGILPEDSSKRLVRLNSNKPPSIGQNGTESTVRPRPRRLLKAAWVLAVGGAGALAAIIGLNAQKSRANERVVEVQFHESGPPRSVGSAADRVAPLPRDMPLQAAGLPPSSLPGRVRNDRADEMDEGTIASAAATNSASSEVSGPKVATVMGSRPSPIKRAARATATSTRSVKYAGEPTTPDWGGRK